MLIWSDRDEGWGRGYGVGMASLVWTAFEWCLKARTIPFDITRESKQNLHGGLYLSSSR